MKRKENLYPINAHFPLSKLLTDKDLAAYFIPHELEPYQKKLEGSGLMAGRLSFLDEDLRPIAPPAAALDLCRVVEHIKNFPVCSTCAARQRPPIDDKPILSECGAGCVKRLVAAIRLNNGRIVGYVRGPDTPTDAFYQLDLNRLPNSLGKDLMEHRHILQSMRSEVVEKAVGRTARRLSRRCQLETRLKILRHTRKALVKSSTPEEVVNAGCSGLQSLFGDVDVAFYALNETDKLKMQDARGPNYFNQPNELDSHQGHIGYVIQTRQALYAPDLRKDTHGFVQPNLQNPLQSVYTVPLRWGASEKAGALQVASMVLDPFSKPDQQCVDAIAHMMELAGVRAALKQERLAYNLSQITSRRWKDCMMQALGAPAGTLVQVLEAKRQLMKGLADEALLLTEAANGAVQVFDANAQVLRFAVCSGPDWTDEPKAREYKSTEQTPGMRALRGGDCLLRDVTGNGFQPVLQKTRSIYAVRLGPEEKSIGVLSVCWPYKLLLESAPPHKESILGLVQQFVSIHNALDSRERDIKDRLVASLGSQPTLNSKDLSKFAQETVNRTKIAFGVRGCSIFLVFPGQRNALLMATTGIMPQKPVWYAPGEGLTGWVLERKRCLRLKDATDKAELNAIDPELKGVRKYVEDPEYVDAHGKRGFLAAPMISQGQVLGIIRMTIKQDSIPFTPEEETLLSQIACEMAATVEAGWNQAEVEKALEATTQEIQDLHLLGLGFAEDYPDVDSLLQQVLTKAVTESQMEWGIARLLYEDEKGKQLVLRAEVGDPPPRALLPKIEVNDLFARSLNAKDPTLIDTHQDPLWKSHLESGLETERKAHLEAVRTAIHVPMRLKDCTIGLIFLESPQEAKPPERVLQFLGMLGGYAAVATELAQARVLAANYHMTLALISEVPHKVNTKIQALSDIIATLPQLIRDPSKLRAEFARLETQITSLRNLCTSVAPYALPDDPASHSETLDLAELLRGNRESYGKARPIGNRVLIDVVAHGEVRVRGYRELLKNAFENLIVNASEAITKRIKSDLANGLTPQLGSLTITVRARDQQIEIGFKDNGIGMDKEMRENCLRLGVGLKTDKGHGIGLAFANSVISMHGGSISVESELGKGSKFTLTLPRGA